MKTNEKYTLTVREAAAYYNIGIRKMRRLAEENVGIFAVHNGNRYLIIRTKFEEFMLDRSESNISIRCKNIRKVYDRGSQFVPIRPDLRILL